VHQPGRKVTEKSPLNIFRRGDQIKFGKKFFFIMNICRYMHIETFFDTAFGRGGSTVIFTSIFVKSKSKNAADRFVLDCLQFFKAMDRDKRNEGELIVI
jgi:hypothetical protein